MSSFNRVCSWTLAFAGSGVWAGATECEDRSGEEYSLVGRLLRVLWSTKLLSFREGMRGYVVVESLRLICRPTRGKSVGPAMGVPGWFFWVVKVRDVVFQM